MGACQQPLWSSGPSDPLACPILEAQASAICGSCRRTAPLGARRKSTPAGEGSASSGAAPSGATRWSPSLAPVWARLIRPGLHTIEHDRVESRDSLEVMIERHKTAAMIYNGGRDPHVVRWKWCSGSPQLDKDLSVLPGHGLGHRQNLHLWLAKELGQPRSVFHVAGPSFERTVKFTQDDRWYAHCAGCGNQIADSCVAASKVGVGRRIQDDSARVVHAYFHIASSMTR